MTQYYPEQSSETTKRTFTEHTKTQTFRIKKITYLELFIVYLSARDKL
jgi:hypothetical protein